ncbi:MAG: hypothetical protein IJ647_05345 [Prevotella sp.]|nr:hypothetical protein [Prevotella sp.]
MGATRQCAAFRTIASVLYGCLALCCSWAGQNRATVATPRISQGIHARRNLGFTAKGDAPVPSYAQKMESIKTDTKADSPKDREPPASVLRPGTNRRRTI